MASARLAALYSFCEGLLANQLVSKGGNVRYVSGHQRSAEFVVDDWPRAGSAGIRATFVTDDGFYAMMEMPYKSMVLQPADLRPSRLGVEVIGVFNPAVVLVDDITFMMVRVAERPLERRAGWLPLPRWSPTGEMAVDWFREEDLVQIDARVVALKSNGSLRLTSVSHFQLFRTVQALYEAWEFVDVILPQGPWEEYGIEDPRITELDGSYWITYVAVSRYGATTALMSSADFVGFQRHGIIFPSENKDVVLFPERIAGDYVALHRPNPRSHFSQPQVWLARSPDLIHWGRHEFLFGGEQVWEGDRVGSGTPPILCNEGWLTLYHGSSRPRSAGAVGSYAAGALLLDRDDPSRILARSSEPIMQASTDFETTGFVPDVVFPTAMLDLGDNLQVFYGAADTCVATLRLSKQFVLDSLQLQNPSES